MTNIENAEFIWNESSIHLDENENFAACRDFQIWTDAWIPREGADKIGSPDLGIGIDYYEAEKIYLDHEVFVQELLKYGIKTEVNNLDLRDLAGY